MRVEGTSPASISILQKALAASTRNVGRPAPPSDLQETGSAFRSAPSAAAESKAPDRVRISPEARALAQAAEESTPAADSNPLQLSAEEQDQVRELQTRDTEVRAHEHAHASAGGALAGSPSFTFQTGPDGRQYAVGGEVPISVSSGATPEETLRNAAQVRAAALAPSEPSSADRSVAAAATSLEMQARQEMAQQKIEAERETEGVAPNSSKAKDGSEADSSAFAVDTGGSVDPRTRAYTAAPAASVEPVLLDLFG
ncbi:MAG: hypothetical protein DHS20C21_15190 [Gemmatimonadota bacterium]|nr:MAG: hypothetical protein DHS20C21_15190 [Gemmatimonadota bacterium]